ARLWLGPKNRIQVVRGQRRPGNQWRLQAGSAQVRERSRRGRTQVPNDASIAYPRGARSHFGAFFLLFCDVCLRSGKESAENWITVGECCCRKSTAQAAIQSFYSISRQAIMYLRR